MKPIVVIVGRPNVGKSTLFNRLVGRRRAIVHDQPGITRDRISSDVDLNGRIIQFVDTGGLERASKRSSDIQGEVNDQVDRAIREADMILAVFDAREGLLAADEAMVSEIRRSGKALIAVLNKIDPGSKVSTEEFFRIGLKNFAEVSAEHGSGIEGLREEILKNLPRENESEKKKSSSVTRVAFLGRPNVGKSSLINKILGEPRLVVSPSPGTTRDAVDTDVTIDGEHYILLDTAGIRKRGKMEGEIEAVSAIRSLQALERADAVILVIDGSEGITTQDQHVASEIMDKGIGLAVAANKWDLAEKGEAARAKFRQAILNEAPFLHFAPLRFVSAKTGEGMEGLLPLAERVKRNFLRRFSHEELKPLFEEICPSGSMTGREGKELRLFGLLQADIRIPTFHLFCNDPRRAKPENERFWQRQLTERLELDGVPIRIVFRRKRSRRR